MKTTTASAAATAALLLPASVSAWGAMGHQTVGYIAQNYMTSDTVSWAQNILDSTYDDYLAYVAPWADTFRYSAGGKFSAPFHFIDAHDDPSSSCNVDFDRDCGDGGCVVTAIQNYTSRVQDSSLSASEQKDALKFLVHFFGDVTQPLHDENYKYGANDIYVTYNGESTNLHHIWDTEMLVQYAGGGAESNAASFSQELIGDIDSGAYASQKSSWIQGMSLDDVQGTVMNFASDANAYVCSYALRPAESTLTSEDLSGDYYTNAQPVFKLQLAKAGYRLAAWLNLLATGSTGLN